MGNLYRFCEPIVLLILARMGEAHGYQIVTEADQFAVTHAGVDSAAVYRALRRLEANGHVTSSWDTGGSGPARRVYTLTPTGLAHLAEWVQVMDQISAALMSLLRESRKAIKGHPGAKRSRAGAVA
jgi:DNA-binding PadR family transcriptional regulator